MVWVSLGGPGGQNNAGLGVSPLIVLYTALYCACVGVWPGRQEEVDGHGGGPGRHHHHQLAQADCEVGVGAPLSPQPPQPDHQLGEQTSAPATSGKQ